MKRTFISVLTAMFLLTGLLTTAHAGSKVVNLQVDGMTTPTCPALLKSAVSKIKGVKQVQASLENNSATIEYDENITNLEKIQDTIESHVGFTTNVR
jgi:copper chaperone CopZ